MKHLLIGGPENEKHHETELNSTPASVVVNDHVYYRHIVYHGDKTTTIIYVWDGKQVLKAK